MADVVMNGNIRWNILIFAFNSTFKQVSYNRLKVRMKVQVSVVMIKHEAILGVKYLTGVWQRFLESITEIVEIDLCPFLEILL